MPSPGTLPLPSLDVQIVTFRTEKAVLMGHTSLVGQIQMRGNTLVTGGSDGSIRVWDLAQLKCVLRMAAHDNSVTSLQFDDKIIVTGGSDGYVKVAPTVPPFASFLSL
jgi:WD40 repeat protein